MSIIRLVKVDATSYNRLSLLKHFKKIGNVNEGTYFFLPVVIVFVFLFVIPMGQSIFFSFTNFNGYTNEYKFIGLSNYKYIFTNSSMTSALSFTLIFAFATTAIVSFFAIPLAVVLNRNFIGKNFVRAAFFFPAIPSVAILGLVWGFILSPLGSGVLNSAIYNIFGAGPVPWLADSTLAQLSTIFVSVWTLTGWHAMLYLAYLQSIPSDFIEAATIDGASRSKIFWNITLPLLTPAMTVSWLLLMTNGLKVFDLPFTLTKGGPGFATSTVTQTIIQQGIASAQVGQASALAVMFLMAVGIVVLVQMGLSRLLERRYT